jgi:protein-S-isoprenylcysteine O-methyltransferase Ste14
MYTALIACGLACAWAAASVWAWPSWGALIAVLALKAQVEERGLLAVHPAYAGYRLRTSRFLPGIV